MYSLKSYEQAALDIFSLSAAMQGH